MKHLLLCLLIFLPLPALSADRVALVIGISEYEAIPPLKNTLNDAEAIARTLERIGFDVTQLSDPGGDAIREELSRFSFRAETADLALIYFAGHGVEVQGENFLIPADAQVASNRDIQAQSVSLKDFLASVDRARKMRIVILDSCRDNPFGDSLASDTETTGTAASDAARSVGQGLAAPSPDRGTLVAYAAKDGNVALDGAGENSPFALALIDKMDDPGLEISLMFRQVRDEVLRLTENRQEPHTYGSLSGVPFFLAGGGSATDAPGGKAKLAWSALRPDDEAQFRQLAAEGDTRSLLGLAFMHLNPNEDRFDPVEAARLLERAANAGSAEAQYELAIQYETGRGVAADQVRALELYRQSAAQDFPDAINDLGFFHYHGMMGLPSDSAKALALFERAADLRHPQAMYNFAALIDDGLIPGKGPKEAAQYLYQALRVGNQDVLKILTEHPETLKPATRRALQEELKRFDLYQGTIDGDFGPGTQRGLRRAYGLES
ncbi:caspase family protein [Ruegeria marina]|uniref:Uncharacterized protein, contains caspase domain n=1 Tax=Ruegeria marina TaxID=639004 RepID=A0A1G7CY84_9RHOB|nr:caspase family protein [Ruegeria marina]SDE44239.1 Uncharacterized protein, contains caspase domain [Ruegeria marina]